MTRKARSGRNPSPEQLREAKRLADLYGKHPENHPNAVAANHSQLAHINTYLGLPDHYVDIVFQCRNCGKEEIWLAESQKWYYETAKGHIDSKAVLCHDCRKKK